MTVDGAKGHKLEVSSEGEVLSHSSSKPIEEAEALIGNSWLVEADVTFDDGNQGGVLFLKNDSDSDTYVVANMYYYLGNSTGGSGDVEMLVTANPTGGTLISEASAAQKSNQQMGGLLLEKLTSYKGAGAGKTVLGGTTHHVCVLATGTNRKKLDVGVVVMPPGTAVALSYTPPSGNTSQRVVAQAEVYKRTLGKV